MAERGLRWVYVRVKHLPPDSALGYEQGRLDQTELLHEWAHTFIQFMAGKRVRTPVMVRPPKKTKKTNDIGEITAFFERYGLVQ